MGCRKRRPHLALELIVVKSADVDAAIAEVVSVCATDLVHDEVAAENACVAVEQALAVQIALAPVAAVQDTARPSQLPPSFHRDLRWSCSISNTNRAAA